MPAASAQRDRQLRIAAEDEVSRLRAELRQVKYERDQAQIELVARRRAIPPNPERIPELAGHHRYALEETIRSLTISKTAAIKQFSEQKETIAMLEEKNMRQRMTVLNVKGSIMNLLPDFEHVLGFLEQHANKLPLEIKRICERLGRLSAPRRPNTPNHQATACWVESVEDEDDEDAESDEHEYDSNGRPTDPKVLMESLEAEISLTNSTLSDDTLAANDALPKEIQKLKAEQFRVRQENFRLKRDNPTEAKLAKEITDLKQREDDHIREIIRLQRERDKLKEDNEKALQHWQGI
ncbi:hypothetical protein IWX90DRAFT_482447 [Phyllosticta citrichinensis]|uniref:Uncharacterized protein n=1 Tax=Phyllosticta citrichinensis TaxID=1130410 RepID=A0ABR1Y738_9PEZI